MNNFEELNSSINYTERHISALCNEVDKLKRSFSSADVTESTQNKNISSIVKHFKQIVKELHQIEDELANFDTLLPEHRDATNKYDGLINSLKSIKNDFDSLKESGVEQKGKGKKIAQEQQDGVVQSVTPAKNNNRTLKLIGGIVLAIIGIILTLQDPENVYYGLIWIGSDFFFVALADFIINKKEEDKTTGGKILTQLICGGLSLMITMLFLMSFS
jgi:hypothetical protein